MTRLLPKSFYVIRHGQSTLNADKMISGGKTNPDLTELGISQAQQAGILFSKLTPLPTRIIVSSLKRTHDTAFHVVGHRNYIKEEDLNERYLGDLDGTISEEEQKQRGVLPGEEAAKDHYERVIKVLNRYLAEDDLTLFVCHGGTIRRILEAANLTGSVAVDNARIYYFMPENEGWRVTEITG